MSIEINKFHSKLAPKHFVSLAIGRRRSGKTTSIISLMHEMKNNYSIVIIFCGSISTCEQYAKHVPKAFIHNNYNENVLKSLIATQESNRKQKKKVRDILIIFDDLAFNNKIFKSKEITFLFFNGRHVNVSVILSTQDAVALSPGLRGNVDFILCSTERNPVYRERIYKYYSVCFKSFAEFDLAYRTFTDNFGMLVLTNFGNGYNLADNIFYYKATWPLPEFKMNANGSWWGRIKIKPQTTGLFTMANPEKKRTMEKNKKIVAKLVFKTPTRLF